MAVPRFGSFVASILAFGSLVVTTTTCAAQGISACDLNGSLQQSTHGVTFDRPSFTSGGQDYPIEVLSLAEPAKWGQNFLCLRYELENVGTDIIPFVYWDLLSDDEALDLVPNSRLKRTKKRPSQFASALRAHTVIKAFRAKKVDTESWQTVEDAQQRKTTNLPAQFEIKKASLLDPVVNSAVASGKLTDANIAVFGPSQKDPKLPIVADQFTAGFGTLTASSYGYLFPAENKITSYFTLTVTPEKGIQFQVFAPATYAWKHSKSSDEFIQRIAEITKEPLGMELQKDGSRRLSVEGIGTSRSYHLYVVQHPITIRWWSQGNAPSSEQTACISIASYSPFPVPVGSSFCNRSPRQ